MSNVNKAVLTDVYNANEVITPAELYTEMMSFIDYSQPRNVLIVDVITYEEAEVIIQHWGSNVNYTITVPAKRYKRKLMFALELNKLIDINKVEIILTKEILKEDFKPEMKFDVTLGNPPYQSPDSSLNIWPLIVEKSIELTKEDGYIALITPNSWMRPSTDIKRKKDEGGSKYIFKDFMQQYNTLTIDTGYAKRYFSEVGTTITWYIIQKSKSQKKTQIIDVTGKSKCVNLENFVLMPMNPTITTISIFEKIQNHYNTFNFKGIRGNGKENLPKSLIKNKEYKYNYVSSKWNQRDHSVNHGCIMEYSKNKHPDYNKPKIIINYIGKIHPYIDNGNSGMDYCQVHFLDSVNECNGAMSVMHSKLFKFIFDHVNYSHHNEAGVLNALPKVDLTRSWTDNELYDYFNLSLEERLYIDPEYKNVK